MTSNSKTAGKPTPRRSRWFAPRPGEWDLAYLGWGVRFYGINPVALKSSDNWSYQLVISGSPTLNLLGRTVATTAGDLFLFAEGCLQGWIDKPDRRSELLVWLWKSPPRCSECIPPRAGYLMWKASPRVVRQLQQIHARCRQEVANPDGLTSLALERLRLELELNLGRMRQSQSPLPAASNRLDLAIRWMQHNLSVRRPVSFLCDYLQVSPSSLERLFLDNLGELPSSHFQRLKMQQASQFLKQDLMSVKEIAFTLGYTHANDFTRAFKKYAGRTPEQEREKSSRSQSARRKA